MALTGTYERTMDDKLRLAIPRQLRDGFRDEVRKNFFSRRVTKVCLSVFSKAGL
jgi:DNA-binding transcriptional regulator/RsmH inhibitor MraZ